jgi:diguanylate cyclase (GGDEF)-like protein
LIVEGYINGVGSEGWSWTGDFPNWSKVRPEDNELFHRIEHHRWNSLNRLLGGQHLTLSISHKGRVRLSELRQALKTGRDRDPTRILLDQRHVEQGVAVAILDATADSPLSIVFLDLNGLKAINDTLGHAKGTGVIEVFFETVSSVIEGRAEAYRNGGDEVVVIAQILKQLATERVDGLVAPITASCGIVTAKDAASAAEGLLAKADKTMYRAKGESKKHAPRASTLAVEDGPVEVIAR